MNSLTKTKTKTKKYWKLKTKLKRKNKKRNKTKTKKIQNENDNNADNSSMNAALRRLAVRAWNTHAFEAVQVPAEATVQFSYLVSICWCWSKILNFPTMLLKCALVQFWIALLSSSGRLARLNIHFCPRSPLIWFQPQHHRRICWMPVQRMWRLTAGKRNRMAKKPWTSRISQNELEVHLTMWTRWTVVSVSF